MGVHRGARRFRVPQPAPRGEARRRKWFENLAEAYLALWGVPHGHVPTVAEAEERLLHLRRHGPTPRAFTFRAPFPPPGGGSVTVIDDRWACPTG